MRRKSSDLLHPANVKDSAQKIGEIVYHTKREVAAFVDGFKAGNNRAIRMIESGKAAVTIREVKKCARVHSL